MSGDGLVSEALNGLVSREDAKNALQIPIGIIPCGSGNTLIGTILCYSHEDYSILNAAFVFVKGLYGPSQCIDAGLCTLSDVNFYFFTSFNFGYVNDVTFESELVRRIGDIRFTFFAIGKLLLSRHAYKADISYLPHDADDDTIEDMSDSS
ncbi:Sphingosine kinase 1 isoform X2 [Oopsacas minuta]|uniref:Sphingosine kinase 1 isoform X2 n=1 Tax=Oopsacas minuta TaxID=111878 RepID=A0AAV7K8F5_9METZ|nr:Sphingosine kinase 1 isoform X2 [Oopsacas minuta]